jgi:hypothetical protein
MPEIDRSVSPPAQPGSPGPTGGASPSAPAAGEKPSKPASPGRDERIDQLTREKYEYKMKWEQASARLEDLAGEVQALKEQVTAAPRPASTSNGTPSSLADLADADLDRVIQQGSNENPEAFALAIRELQRRTAEQAMKGASKHTEQQIELERDRLRTQAQIQKQFGDNAWDPNGELYKRADRIYGEMIAEAEARFGRGKGRSTIESMPSVQRRCFELADRELRHKELDELPTLRRELELRKQQEALFTGNARPVERDENFKDALKRKDRKGLFQALVNRPRDQGS